MFWSIYGLSHCSVFFDAIGIFFAEYTAYVWAGVLVFVFIWPSRERVKDRMMIVLGVIAAVIARLVVKAGIVLAIPRPRPFVSMPSVHPLLETLSWENLQSFPSGHAVFFFALATVIYCFNKKVGGRALGVAALIGISRVYVGVHWPSDVLGGAILGALTGWLVYRWYCTSRFYV